MSAAEISVWATLAEACRAAVPTDVWAGLQNRVGGDSELASVLPVPEPGPSRCGQCGKPCAACAAASVAPAGYTVLPPGARAVEMDEHATRVALRILEPIDDDEPLHSRRPRRRTSPVPRQGSGRA